MSMSSLGGNAFKAVVDRRVKNLSSQSVKEGLNAVRRGQKKATFAAVTHLTAERAAPGHHSVKFHALAVTKAGGRKSLVRGVMTRFNDHTATIRKAFFHAR